MIETPRAGISQIPEITERLGIWHFGASSLWGVATGTAAMILGFSIINGPELQLADIGGAMMFFAFFVSLFVLAAMLAVGLPLTFVLRLLGLENAALYAACGAAVGFIMLAVLFELPQSMSPESFLGPVSGALSGFATALRWGRWREQATLQLDQRADENASAKRTNPIHDLIH